MKKKSPLLVHCCSQLVTIHKFLSDSFSAVTTVILLQEPVVYYRAHGITSSVRHTDYKVKLAWLAASKDKRPGLASPD